MIQRVWYRFWQYMAFVVLVAVYRVRFFGRKHIPQTGPLLLVSNHQSFLDPILCGVGLHRPLDYIARDSLFRNRVFGWYIRSLNTFPIHRDQADVQAIKTIIQRLNENRGTVLFPEGTRTADGRIQDIKAGFDLIVRRSGATVVPVVIDGAFEVWPRHRALPGGGDIRIVFGEAFTADQVRKLGREEFVREINIRMRKMQGELRKQYGKKEFEYGTI